MLWGLAAVPASRLSFDRSIENMFSRDDPARRAYERSVRIFGSDEVVVVAFPAAAAADQELAAQRALTRRLAQVPGVESVLSLATVPAALRALAGARLEDLFENLLISADRQTAAVLCTLQEPQRASVPRQETIDRLRAAAREHHPQAVLAGAPIMIADGFRYVEEDGRLLGWLATALLAAVIGLCFRSVRWVVAPFVVVHVALALTHALLVLSGWQLSMVSSMLWAIVTVIGVATSVHVIVRFREKLAAGHAPREALQQTGSELLGPIFWTCATDAAGFAALVFAQVGPVQDFGRMMAVGALMTAVALALWMPGLALVGQRPTATPMPPPQRHLRHGLVDLLHAILHRPRTVVAITGLLAVVSALGLSRVRVESDFTSNFRAYTEVSRSYQFVESRFGGAGVWEVNAAVPLLLTNGSLSDPRNSQRAWHAFVQQVRQLQEQLRAIEIFNEASGRSEPGITKVLSLVDLHDAIPEAQRRELQRWFRGGNPVVSGLSDLFGIRPPQDEPHSFLALLRGMQWTAPHLLRPLWAEDPDSGRVYFRILLRAREQQPSDQKKALIAEVRRIVDQFAQSPANDAAVAALADPSVTGYFVLLTSLIESLIRDQWITFGIASAAIFGMLVLAFGSPLPAAIAMVPNLVPILVVMGWMGWLNIKLNMGAVMIAAVSIGLAVDSSIHYIASYRRARQEGAAVVAALQRVQQSVGRAVVLSTLALVVGFSAMAFSQFVPIVYFGMLVGITLLGGLVGNLIVLPLLLWLAEREERPEPDAAAASVHLHRDG